MAGFPFLSAKTWAIPGLIAVLASGATFAYMAIDSRATTRCERDAQLVAFTAAEEAHQYYLAEVTRGDELSERLLKTQRKLNAKEYEYITYANAVTGLVDPSVRVLVQYASGAKDGVPKATISTPDAPVTEAPIVNSTAITRAIAANIAINYARLDHCVAGFNALIDWHKPEAMVSIARLEVRLANNGDAVSRAFESIDKISGELGKHSMQMDERIKRIEETAPINKLISGWVLAWVAGAVGLVGGAVVAKVLGL